MSAEPVARRELLAKALGASAMLGAAAANAEIDYAGVGFLGGAKQIDVNNANVRVYQKLPGVYPNAAGKIVSKAPYKSKEDMYSKAGFSSADFHDIGPSIAVTHDDRGKAQAIAEELMDYAWEQRHFSSIHFTPLKEAMARAKAGEGMLGPEAGGKPVVISDYSDNPGSGAYGDATNLLRAVLDRRRGGHRVR